MMDLQGSRARGLAGSIAAGLALFALVCGVVVAQGLVFHWLPVDDAYISFRYAKNAVDGHGFVFNIGERVEGYTSSLWVFLLALAGRCGFDIPRAGFVLS